MLQDKIDILIATFRKSDKSRLFNPTVGPSIRKVLLRKGEGEETTNAKREEERWGEERTEDDGDAEKGKRDTVSALPVGILVFTCYCPEPSTDQGTWWAICNC